jgi:SNF2 family DNA or RNA helicase
MRYTFKTKPFSYQRDIVVRGIKQKHIGLLWEPGTGKTKATIDWFCALHMLGRVDRVLVVCPLSVLGVWEDELELHAPIPYVVQYLDAKVKGPLPRPPKGQLTILISNYDIVWRRDEYVRRFNPDAIVADESHLIKKASARRSRYLRRYNTTPYRAILTGTPNPRSFLDLYAQWVFLNPKRFGTSIARFKDTYVRYGGFKGYQVTGYRNVDQLLENVYADADVQHKSKDLPPETRQRVPVELTKAGWEAYAKMAYELFLELKGGEVVDAKNVAVKILRLQQITGGWIKSEEGNIHQVSDSKIRACDERLEDLFNDDERVVVFARFKPELDAITALGVRRGIPTYVLRGGVGREERDQARRQFQSKDGPSLFVAQIQAGGLGITLHSAAEVVFYSVTYNLADYIQACSRIHREGQKRPVRYQHLVARGTVDLDIYAALRAKQDLLDLVMKKPKTLAKSIARNLGIDWDD